MLLVKTKVSAEVMKIIALLAMTIDHVDKIFIHSGVFSETVGRWAFPIFSFLMMSSFCRFHPVRKYVFRLGFFAVITSLLFRLFPDQNQSNILCTFLWSIIYVYVCEWVCARVQDPVWQRYWLGLCLLILMPFILTADYSLFGFLFLMAVYAYCRRSNWVNYIAVLITGTAMNSYAVIPAISSFLMCWLLLSVFNIEYKKRILNWWFFYIYYPLHLVWLYWVYSVFCA